MSTLDILDRHENKTGTKGEKEHPYQTYDEKNILLHVDTRGDRPSIVTAFRAHDKPGGRSNRYYAWFKGDSIDTLFRDCRQELEERAEELEWQLDTHTSDNRVKTFTSLTEVDPHPINDDKEWSVFLRLLQQNPLLDFGTRDVAFSVGIIKQIIQIEGQSGSFAVSLNGRVSELRDVHLVLKPGEGGRDGFQPLGKSRQDFAEALENWEEAFLEKKMNDIRKTIVEEVQELWDKTNHNRNRVQQELQKAINRAFEQTNQNLRVVTQDRLQSLKRAENELASIRESAPHGSSSKIPPNIQRGLIALSLVLIVIVAFIGGNVLGLPSLTGLPVVGGFVGSGEDITWASGPAYNSSSGELTLTGTAPPEADFVVVNLSHVSGDDEMSVPVQVGPEGRFTLERRVDYLFGTEFTEISEGKYNVTARAGGERSNPKSVTIVHPTRLDVFEPTAGQQLSVSTLTVIGRTNAGTLEIRLAGDEYESSKTLQPDGRFETTFAGLPSNTSLTLTLTAHRESETESKVLTVSTVDFGGPLNASSSGSTPTPTETPTANTQGTLSDDVRGATRGDP